MQSTPSPTISLANKQAATTQLQKIRSSQTALSIFILLLVGVLLWIIVTVFSSNRDSQISAEAQQLATPLNPNLDVSVLDTLDAKTMYSDNQLSDFPIYVIVRDNQTQTEQVVPLGTQLAPTQPTITTPSEPVPTPTTAPAATQPATQPDTQEGAAGDPQTTPTETEPSPASE